MTRSVLHSVFLELIISDSYLLEFCCVLCGSTFVGHYALKYNWWLLRCNKYIAYWCTNWSYDLHKTPWTLDLGRLYNLLNIWGLSDHMIRINQETSPFNLFFFLNHASFALRRLKPMKHTRKCPDFLGAKTWRRGFPDMISTSNLETLITWRKVGFFFAKIFFY